MAPIPAVPKLTISERLEKLSSPTVEILVGTEMKQYLVPIDILCYYSQYFDRCFHGGFKEAVEKKLTLPEDFVEDFDILLEYMLTGHVPNKSFIEANNEHGLQKCMSFIEYADQYSLGEAGMAVRGNLIKILGSRRAILQPGHIETIFRVFPEKHAMRELIAKAALNAGFSGKVKYTQVEQEVDGFASEMLRHLRRHVELQTVGRKRDVIPLDRDELPFGEYL